MKFARVTGVEYLRPLAVAVGLVSCALFASGAPPPKTPIAPAAKQAAPDLLAATTDAPVAGVSYPALSPDGKTICFTYLGDLWSVPTRGGTASRLTINEALDATPHWSPDGKWIAFTSLRTGNADVFLIPSDGGEARQVTQFSGADWVTDWSPDGNKLVIYSVRDTHSFAIYTFDLHTRDIKRLTNDVEPLRFGALSPDGKTLAYTRSGQPWWRPWYRGSVAASTVLEDVSTGAVHTLLKSNTQQFWPLWSQDGRGVFISTILGDGNTPNLWRVPVSGGSPKQITHYTTDAVRYPTIARNGSLLAYIYNGHLYSAKPDGSDEKLIPIFARTDDKVNNQERQVLTQEASNTVISPDGKQIAMVLRGNIWVIPVTGGDATRLTDDQGDYGDIDWSPDSTKITLISDRGDQTDLYVLDVKTKALSRLTNDPAEESDTEWSPDGKYISFAKAGPEPGLYAVAADGHSPERRLAEGNGNNDFGNGITSHAWSPDSRWLAFSRSDRFENRDIWVVPILGGVPTNVSRYPGNNMEPQFTRDGRRLLFMSDRGSAPLLYQIMLETPDDAPAEEAAKRPARDRSKDVKIDFTDIQLRAKPAMPPIGVPDSFLGTPDGHRVLVHMQNNFWVIPLDGGGIQQLTASGEAGGNPRFTPDGSRFFYTGANGTPRSLSLGGGQPSVVPFSADYIFDRRAQYLHAFNEFYRKFGSGFYDPKMHGVDWHALHDKYIHYLQGVGTASEFANLLSEMVGEVNSSHSEVGANEKTGGPTTATLGLNYDPKYSGVGLKVVSVMQKGPADKPASRISPGEYLLAINGVDVTMNEDYYAALQDKVGKPVDLLVNNKPTKEGARTVKLKPISTGEWTNLEYEEQVRHNREVVDRISAGRLAYIRIKGMDQPSLQRFTRELWSEAANKDGLVLDIRGNGGGNTHDEILEVLARHVYMYTQPRDGIRESQPKRAFTKPIVLLIDQNSYSDAEIFPAGFRAMNLGKIVGVPTPGYVIGTYEGTLVDGTHYRVPSWGWYTSDGKNLENYGVQPDIYVENTPEDIAAGRDRQLEAAIETLLKEAPTSSVAGNSRDAGPLASANANPNGGSSAVRGGVR